VSAQHVHIHLQDDGVTLELEVSYFTAVGGLEVGPRVLFQTDLLSSPAPDLAAWIKDSLVQVIERL